MTWRETGQGEAKKFPSSRANDVSHVILLVAPNCFRRVSESETDFSPAAILRIIDFQVIEMCSACLVFPSRCHAMFSVDDRTGPSCQ